jgi:hypothetical protein
MKIQRTPKKMGMDLLARWARVMKQMIYFSFKSSTPKPSTAWKRWITTSVTVTLLILWYPHQNLLFHLDNCRRSTVKHPKVEKSMIYGRFSSWFMPFGLYFNFSRIGNKTCLLILSWLSTAWPFSVADQWFLGVIISGDTPEISGCGKSGWSHGTCYGAWWSSLSADYWMSNPTGQDRCSTNNTRGPIAPVVIVRWMSKVQCSSEFRGLKRAPLPHS